jgi:hypothetical protein
MTPSLRLQIWIGCRRRTLEHLHARLLRWLAFRAFHLAAVIGDQARQTIGTTEWADWGAVEDWPDQLPVVHAERLSETFCAACGQVVPPS